MPRVGLHRKGAHHEHFASRLGHVEVYPLIFVGKDSQVSHFVDDVLQVRIVVDSGHPQIDQEPLFDGGDRPAIHHHRGFANSLYDCTHSVTPPRNC